MSKANAPKFLDKDLSNIITVRFNLLPETSYSHMLSFMMKERQRCIRLFHKLSDLADMSNLLAVFLIQNVSCKLILY